MQVRRRTVEGMEERPGNGGEDRLPAEQPEQRVDQAVLDVVHRATGLFQVLADRPLDAARLVRERQAQFQALDFRRRGPRLPRQAELALQARQQPRQALALGVAFRRAGGLQRQRMGLGEALAALQAADRPQARAGMAGLAIECVGQVEILSLLAVLGELEQQLDPSPLQPGVGIRLARQVGEQARPAARRGRSAAGNRTGAGRRRCPRAGESRGNRRKTRRFRSDRCPDRRGRIPTSPATGCRSTSAAGGRRAPCSAAHRSARGSRPATRPAAAPRETTAAAVPAVRPCAGWPARDAPGTAATIRPSSAARTAAPVPARLRVHPAQREQVARQHGYRRSRHRPACLRGTACPCASPCAPATPGWPRAARRTRR